MITSPSLFYLRATCLRALVAVALVAMTSILRSAEFKVRPDRETGVYASGETATWTIEALHLKPKEMAPTSISYKLVSNNLDTLQEGELALKNGHGQFSATRQTPGTLTLILEVPAAKEVTCGAVFDPQKLKPSLPRPVDFDDFWTKATQEAQAVPLNPVLASEESPNQEIELWQVTLDNVRNAKIRGQLARPKGHPSETFPGMIIFQWAGFYPLAKPWAVEPAAQGWLVLNLQAHDIPIYETREAYQQIQDTTHHDFYKIGNEDRESSYYLGMYLSTVQAIRYLKSRPDWDGRVLVVRGGSQGGMLALVAAALNAESVTAVMAKVPGGCDLNGAVAGNRSGFPDWWNAARERPDSSRVRRVAEYYDVVNFAPLIKASTLIGIALGDLTCPPVGMFITGNQLKAPHEIFILPSAAHGTTPINPHKPYDNKEANWLRLLKQNRPPPAAR